jgi:hypothetical protein
MNTSSIEPYRGEEGQSEEDRLFHEINLLRLEGYYFCLDPKAASRRKTAEEFFERLKNRSEIAQRPITISPHPSYGYPSVLAYKVLQAILKKLSDYGYPAPNTVSFSQRELARLVGRSSFGGADQQDFFRAIKQLQHTEVTCWFFHKDQDTWAAASLTLLASALFSGKNNRITQCCVYLHPIIIKSLNDRFAFCLNYGRLDSLEPIATALFKHLFFHFSNLYSQKRTDDFSFTKDYASICATWLGGIKPERYKSKILANQLGRHLRAIRSTKLVRTWEIHKNADGDGFNIEFFPGAGFFEDYARFYLTNGQLEIQFAKANDERTLQKPIELVSYFYKRLYQTDDLEEMVFSDKDTELASSLLEKHSFSDIQEWIDYAIRKAGETRFDMKTFGGIKVYRAEFWLDKKRLAKRKEAEARREQEQRERRLMDEYSAYRKVRLNEIRGTVTPQDLAAIEAVVRTRVEADNPHRIGREFLVRAQADKVLAERFAVPSFDEWQRGLPR